MSFQKLRESVKRLSDLEVQGVESSWTATEIGMELSVRYGADKVHRTISWADIDRDPDLFRRTENQALKGISS